MTAGPTAAAWVQPTAWQWVAIAAVGVTSIAAQLLMTYALRFVRAAVAGVIAQFTPVAALGMGYVFLRESIAGVAVAGAAITLAGVTWGAYQASND
jgi:drug/metabolite transporter (DMT)-like permease